MTIQSYPWNQNAGGQYLAQTYVYEREMYNRLYYTDGIIAGSRYKLAGTGNIYDKSCLVVASSPADLYSNVNLGVYLINGTQARITVVEQVEHNQNLSGNPRIDVVYLKKDDSTQLVTTVVSEGTPAASPVATLLTDTATVNYAELARITIPNAGNVTDANIVNVRRYARAAGLLASGKVLFDARTTSSELPEDELELDGSAVKQVAYPDLYAAIGTTWNTGGEASDEFRLPYAESRFPIFVGANTGLSNAYAEGDVGGAEEIAITEAELASHIHTETKILSGSGGLVTVAGSTGSGNQTSVNTTLSTGSDEAHDNIPPYIAFIGTIKI